MRWRDWTSRSTVEVENRAETRIAEGLPRQSRAAVVTAMGRADVHGHLDGAQRPVVESDFVDHPLEVGESIAPAADREKPRPTHSLGVDLADDLGLGVAVEIDYDFSAFTYEREMVPHFECDLGLAGKDLAGVAAF